MVRLSFHKMKAIIHHRQVDNHPPFQWEKKILNLLHYTLKRFPVLNKYYPIFTFSYFFFFLFLLFLVREFPIFYLKTYFLLVFTSEICSKRFIAFECTEYGLEKKIKGSHKKNILEFVVFFISFTIKQLISFDNTIRMILLY